MKKIKNKQQGLVSILVTMIFLIVISLIVIGFAQVARREQRQALDRQLSSQAFYAAESGINDAMVKINGVRDPANPYSKNNDEPQDKNDCTSDAPGFTDIFTNDLGDGVSYTCLLIDQTPETLEWGSVDPSKSTVTPIRAYDSDGTSTNFDNITFEWQNADSLGSSFPAGNNFPAFNTWNAAAADNAAPVLRVDLAPIDSVITRSTLLNETSTIFFRPSSDPTASNSIAYSSGTNQGAILSTSCDNSVNKKCNATITGLNKYEYQLRIRTEYKSATVSMKAIGKNINNGTLEGAQIGGAQAEIDSTGKAADVLKRIRVKMPYKNGVFGYPEGVTESGTALCKRLIVYPRNPSPDFGESDCTGGSVSTPITPPGPPPAPSPSPAPGGAGNAEFQSCVGGECSGASSGTPAYRWTYTAFNTSGNPSNIVKNCTWQWGDGSSNSGTASKPSNACLNGQFIKHTYPKLESPLVCRIYTVTLTVYFNNGFAPRDYTSKRYVPNGTKGTSECAGKYSTYNP